MISRISAVTAIVLCAACAASAGADADAASTAGGCFTIEDLQRLRWAANPVISRDGGWVAYTLAEPPDTAAGARESLRDVWLCDFEGNRAPRPFAFGPADEHSPAFSPDGRWLAFLSDRAERGTYQLYRIRLSAGEAERVTGFEGGVRSFEWRPDGRSFAVLTVDPVPREVARERECGDDERVIDAGKRCARLRVIDAETGTGEAVTPDFVNVVSMSWTPDGSRLAIVVSDGPDEKDIYWNARLERIDPESGSSDTLLERAAGDPDWSRDGRYIACGHLVKHDEIGVLAPVIAVVDTRGGSVQVLGEQHVGMVRSPRWHPDGGKLYVFERMGVRARLSLLHVGRDRVEPVEELLVPYYSYDAFDLSGDGGRIVCMKGGAVAPPEIWRIERSFLGGTRRLTDVNPWLAERKLPLAETVTWQSRDGTTIEGVLLLPPDYREGERYPTVINIHGGPQWAWWLGWHGSWHDWGVPLACRGFVVLLPNPRGSAGYGVGFARANFDDWGGGDYEDILAGADYLVERGLADPERLGVGGWSYGGAMTSWIITQTDRFAAAVVGAGVTNLVSFHGTTDITPDFLEMYLRDIPYRRPGPYRDRSPISHVANARTPTLVLHGEEDVRVPVGQAYELYRGLRQVGVETELVVYPREGHGFREILHQMDLLERVCDWFERHLAP